MVMHIKFLASVMGLGLMSIERDVMPPYFFPADNKEVMERIVRP